MLQAKRALVAALGPHCSSMLFDPNYAIPAAIDILPPRCGLIVTLEEHRTEETPEGRRSRAIDSWSVAKIRALGGDAVKVLAWYRPDADGAVLDFQKRFVRGIGEECRRNDIPYVLELLVYPFMGTAGHTADYVESPGKLPALVIDSVREFARPEYGVDLMKLESPLAAGSLPARDGSREAADAQSQFRRGRRDLPGGGPSLGPPVGRRRAGALRTRPRLRVRGGSGRVPGRTHDLARRHPVELPPMPRRWPARSATRACLSCSI